MLIIQTYISHSSRFSSGVKSLFFLWGFVAINLYLALNYMVANYRFHMWLQHGDFHSFVAPPILWLQPVWTVFWKDCFSSSCIEACWGGLEDRTGQYIPPCLSLLRKQASTTGTVRLWGQEACRLVARHRPQAQGTAVSRCHVWPSAPDTAVAINKQCWKPLAQSPSLFKTVQQAGWPSPSSFH